MSDKLLCYSTIIGGWEKGRNLFAYPIFPDSLIFPSIGKVQDSFSMKHAVLHFPFISGECWECVLSYALHPKTDKRSHYDFENHFTKTVKDSNSWLED